MLGLFGASYSIALSQVCFALDFARSKPGALKL